ncbi:MAG: glutathione peroxidase [Moraxella sp.]|uniref:glutathione peroxidase n=1 Tax=Moraxella sp. TaxID=479 RepID=UPI0026DC11DE|nr:glutathione peroxidase [Moraxella sp.]MDO4450246.1 glutathione peroxidase [Moraxella sp.]
MSIYQFHAKDIHGNMVSFEQFKNKTLLIVNTATSCSLTPQHEELEELYQKYKNQDFIILGFPSNGFGETSETEPKILEFLQANYPVSFPLFAKIDVNDDNAHPLYTYLKAHRHDEITNKKYDVLLEVVAEMGLARTGSDIKWNFTKFLINRHGEVVARFAPTVGASEMESVIIKALA